MSRGGRVLSWLSIRLLSSCHGSTGLLYPTGWGKGPHPFPCLQGSLSPPPTCLPRDPGPWSPQGWGWGLSVPVPPKSWLPWPLLSSALPQAAGSISAQNRPPHPKITHSCGLAPAGLTLTLSSLPRCFSSLRPSSASLRPTPAWPLSLGTPGSCSPLRPRRATPAPPFLGS